ncbi:hypothetical protein BG60_29060 [Caballeronia zhejiangensis]|uniref:Uncharacterized protein n=1 Tax=Caballeronia zhejiangensis TaxID=871203 RepID=A0A656QM68_9BURK|nr:hypothetical protein BG60_29060 [Caballeronia zhejiangensis]
MLNISVKENTRALVVSALLDPKAQTRAIARALNKTARQARGCRARSARGWIQLRGLSDSEVVHASARPS